MVPTCRYRGTTPRAPQTSYAPPVGGRRRAQWRLATDWLPVVAVAAVSAGGIGLEQPWTGTDLSLAGTSLILALPLAVRRQQPLLTDVLLAAALVAQMSLGGSLHFGSFVAVLVAAHATGRHTAAWPSSVLGAAVLLAGAVGANAASAMVSPDEVFFPVFYVSAAVALGRVVRRLAEQAEDLRVANAALARERDTAARLAAATERVRLARELHDVVAHLLMVMVVQAEAGEESLERDPAAARRALRRIQSTGRGGLDDLRSMVRILRSDGDAPAPPELADLGTLVAVLGEAGLDVRIVTGVELDSLGPDLGGQLYRVVQEALTNIVKHSAATSAEVRLHRNRDTIRLEVRDPGPSLGTGGTSGTSGHGVRGMAERVAQFGGTVDAGARDGGYAVLVTVPHPSATPGPERSHR